jgi:hypothetical protein
VEFLHILHNLMDLSNVKFIRMEPKAQRDVIAPLGGSKPMPLPAPPAPVTQANQPPPPPPAAPDYTLEKLPLGAKAITSVITVRGSYQNVRTFLWRLAMLKADLRAVNINEASVGSWNDKTGTVDARLTVTRFVRPLAPLAPGAVGVATPEPLAAGQPALAGGAPGAVPAAASPAFPPAGPAPSVNGQEATHKLFPSVKEADPMALLHRQK